MQDRVKKVTVVNPYQFEVIRKSVKKTDKHDVKTLALYLSKDRLPEVRMKTKENAQLHSLATTRDKLVQLH
ncbi:MAG TPA: transposase [Planctomycetes bacterium]|nr:transposase [Planctomycetota bacterium]HIJ71198.1 transposase [Planctomycetota bacterium]